VDRLAALRQLLEFICRARSDAGRLTDPELLGEEFREMSQIDVARTFGEGFARQLAAEDPGRWGGPSSRASECIRLHRRASEGKRAAARWHPGGRAAGVAERVPDRG